MGEVKGNPNGAKGRYRRNPRGQGGRLREAIIEAADALWAESGDAEALSLRGVARRVGIAATSIYLHFPDIEHLTAAVAERHFAELSEFLKAAGEGVSDPVELLLVRCRAYCRFALEKPEQYRVLFEAKRPDLGPDTTTRTLEASAGRPALDSLTRGIERCREAGVASPGEDTFRSAVLVWVMLHGLISLRISRPQFPWPPLGGMVDEAVGRLIGLDREASA